MFGMRAASTRLKRSRLVGGDEQALEVLVHGEKTLLLLALACDDRPQGPALVGELPGHSSGRPPRTGLRSYRERAWNTVGRVRLRVGLAQELVDEFRRVVLSEGLAQEVIVLVVAESLGAEVVRHAAAGQDGQDLLGRSRTACGRGRASLRSRTTKRLPRRWPGLSLFVCRLVFRTRTSARDSCSDRSRLDVLDGDPLPGDGVRVLEARRPISRRRDVQGPGDAVEGLPRAEPFLLDLGVDVRAGAAGLVEGSSSTKKSSGRVLMTPPTPGRSGQKRKWIRSEFLAYDLL